jgi:hypothetical protein
MKPTEIITADVKNNGGDSTNDLNLLAQAVQQKKVIVLQNNDSVLLLFDIGNGSVEMHLYTVDSPLKLAKSLIQFIKQIRSTSIKTVYGKDEPKQTLQLLKKFGIDILPSDKTKYKWMAKV